MYQTIEMLEYAVMAARAARNKAERGNGEFVVANQRVQKLKAELTAAAAGERTILTIEGELAAARAARDADTSKTRKDKQAVVDGLKTELAVYQEAATKAAKAELMAELEWQIRAARKVREAVEPGEDYAVRFAPANQRVQDLKELLVQFAAGERTMLTIEIELAAAESRVTELREELAGAEQQVQNLELELFHRTDDGVPVADGKHHQIPVFPQPLPTGLPLQPPVTQPPTQAEPPK